MHDISQITVLVTILTFLLADIWVMNSVSGFIITSVIDRAAESNQLWCIRKSANQFGAWIANYHSYPGLWSVSSRGIALLLLITVFSRAGRNAGVFIFSALIVAFVILTGGDCTIHVHHAIEHDTEHQPGHSCSIPSNAIRKCSVASPNSTLHRTRILSIK